MCQYSDIYWCNNIDMFKILILILSQLRLGIFLGGGKGDILPPLSYALNGAMIKYNDLRIINL